MLKSLFSKNWPHLVAVLLFIVLGLAYFSPAMQGKILKTHDKSQHMGMSKEIVDFRIIEEEEPLWTNSMFGGMPAYMISTKHPSNLFKSVHKVLTLGLPHPVGTVFLYMLGFYILLLVMKVDPWLAILGAIAFAFSSYYFVILDAGHNTKALAIAYMSQVVAGVVLTLRGKYIWGAIVTAFFLALEISVNHLQITYYLGLAIGIFMLTHLVQAIREKGVPAFFKSAGFLIAAAVVAVLCNMSAIWTSLEYSDYTTRGKTELTIKADGTSNEDIRTSGLDKKYVTDWSYGIEETLTFIIPNAKGGASSLLINDASYMKKLARKDKEAHALVIQNVQEYQDPNIPNAQIAMKYWGNQSITSGPVYMGIIVFYLFLLGMFFKKGYLRWAALAIFLLTVMLGWGKNFMPLTEFFLDYFPGYNKFRAVTIILSITEFVVPFLGVLGLKYVIDNREWFENNWVRFAAVSGGFLIVLVLLALTPNSFLTFFSEKEASYYNGLIDSGERIEYAEGMIAYLGEYRMDLFKTDAWRSIYFLAAAIALVFLYIKKILPKLALVSILAILILGDLWTVDKRYLNNDDRSKDNKRWVSANKVQDDLNPKAADVLILGAKQNQVQNFSSILAESTARFKEENGIRKINDAKRNAIALSVLNANSNYRVLNLTNPLNESRTSYFHKSLGGYHGAKLKRYQELIEFHIANPKGGEIQKAFAAIQAQPSASALNNPAEPLHILNMLNTEFIIYDANNDRVPPFPNPNAYGNGWFVQDVNWAKNSDEEIIELGKIDPSIAAIVDERFKSEISGNGGSGDIVLDSYKPNHLTYTANCSQPGLAVFSEIFYDAGWQAYLDGSPVEHVRADYVLRAMDIPEGQHKIEFIFEPNSYSTGSIISLIFSALVILAFIWQIVQFVRNHQAERA